MDIKHRYIINEQAHKAYPLGDIEFNPKTNGYTTFQHSELKQLPKAAYLVISQDLRSTDNIRVEHMPSAIQRVYYDIVPLNS
ncbi:TPA: hypothetical protein RQJ59_001787 [Vibrio vulnificus]|nr:hypothetical protein [Vibrio vulnificus]